MALKPDGYKNRISIVNHRGANRLAPENTFASAKEAIEAGAEYVEVDVRRSKDGVYYNLHDSRLERTTNGSGLLSETTSEVVDKLDAGSWFSHSYSNERIPRFDEYLKWIKGKAKVYFDMKDVNLEEFIPKVYKLGLEKDCFFWFSDWVLARKFRRLYPDLTLKINASAIGALDSLSQIYHPQIIECSVHDLTETFMAECHKKGMKVMPNISGNEFEDYKIAIDKQVDMVNIDNPDIFSNMVKNGGEFKKYKLIAHRGGIVEGKYNEFDPASIQAAIDRGYYMLEMDVRETKDSVLIVNHDADFNRFFNNPIRVNEATWGQVKALKSDKGNYHPLLFEEVAKMCSGKVNMMIDVKINEPSSSFYKKLGKIMEEYNLLSGAYFIDYEAEKYFFGKSKFYFRVREIPRIKEKMAKGEDVASNYFLFDGGKSLNAEVMKWSQQNYITVVPSINIMHYKVENYKIEAEKDIEFLKKCGVTEFQIDSDFDIWLPNKE
jgi:glycerophosphoryl diester phosphodiesterase